MRFFVQLLFFITATLPCFAEMGDEEAKPRFAFFQGYTNITCYDFHVKITAEQRSSDKEVLIIAIPQEQGVHFNIQNVQFAQKHPNIHLEGAVAKVHGHFVAQYNMAHPQHVSMMVPVQVAIVNEFSISPNEALIQGNNHFQKKLPKLLSEGLDE